MTVRTRCSRTTPYRDRTRELAERRQGSRRTLAKGHRRPCLGGCGWHLCLRWPGRRGATALCGTSLGPPLLALPQLGADEALDSAALSFLLNHALEENEKEEEKERRKREEELRKEDDVPVSVEWVQLLDDKGKTHCWNRRTWYHRLEARPGRLGRPQDEGGCTTTGTGFPVSVRTTSLLFLQGEGATASPGR